MAEIIYLGGNYMLENWIKPQILEEEELMSACMQHALSCLCFRCRLREHGLHCNLCCLRAGVNCRKGQCAR